ncbi:VOC family protein [Thioalkalivibrio sp. ALJ1]|uniref:VOC family protein n=1 Tax=Thioalkalivibrio sp. ALJ1 TaxID=1158144 RepID=UPI000571F657|nr:VOC family protein [Thioalkalivibrio sp. ALJ1]
MSHLSQIIVPHLMFDNEARAAVDYYCSIFPDSSITYLTTLHDTPGGDCDVVSFVLWGHAFMAINAGSMSRFNPSISFMVNFDPSRDPDARARIDEIWAKLADGGQVLMPLDRYPFSERYGWIQDRFGLSWQLILTDPQGEERPPIIPSLLFVGNVCGKAEEASDFYLSKFRHSQRGQLVRYPSDMEPDREGTVMFTDFMLEGQWFAAMDSAQEHDFGFNEAISFVVNCADQQEIDQRWESLSAFPEAEQCGWLKDPYGISWHIVPEQLSHMLKDPDPDKLSRVTQCILKMKKVDLAALQGAYDDR